MPQWCRWAGVVWAQRNSGDIVIAVVITVLPAIVETGGPQVRNWWGTGLGSTQGAGADAGGEVHLLMTGERGQVVGALPGVALL